jgi:putative methyltransferase (TIGR04325 family)
VKDLLRCGTRRLRRLLRKNAPNHTALPHSAEPPEWEVVPEWLPEDSLRGWNVSEVSATQEHRWQEFLQQLKGPEPLGVSHESPASLGREQIWSHNLIMSYGYVLGRVVWRRTSLTLLDWGAGVGHYYPITRTLYPQIELQYTAFDLAALCNSGRGFLPEVCFLDEPKAALNGRYQLVMAGSSLWYSRYWQETLTALAAASEEWLYVTRMIFVRQNPSFVVVQRPWKYGYDTEYQCWVLNRQEFLQAAETAGMSLEREFIFGTAPAIHGASEQGTFRGFLFRRRGVHDSV